MGSPRFVFEWHITMRNERMGYGKSFVVEGMNHRDAIERARAELADGGRYNPDEFDVIELARKSIVRRAA